MTVGLAPFPFINNDLAHNVSQIERGLKLARGKADLLCFGEAFLQGFDSMNWQYAHDRDVAVRQDDDVIRTLCDLTVAYGVDLLFGYLEREQEQLYSSCMVIEKGRILHNYRRMSKGWKKYWLTDEHYREGTVSENFSYKGQTLRIALCGDLWDFPERFQTNGVLIWPVCCNFTQQEWESEYRADYLEQACLPARKTLFVDAIDHEADCVRAAFCFEEGRVAAQLHDSNEEILYVTLKE